MKKFIVTIWLVLLLFIAAGLFWYNDWIYQLPTPLPTHYKAVHPGQAIPINIVVKDHHKPILLHFFNPECPCSRFNISNFKHLYKRYSHHINFVIIVMSNKTYTVQEIQDKFNLPIPVSFDSSIAVLCGVYATPQVALLDNQHKLYYRGNYNRSRYCTDEKTNYAKMAISELLTSHASPVYSQLALKAYGCQLPACIR
jgi:hypothetical protein